MLDEYFLHTKNRYVLTIRIKAKLIFELNTILSIVAHFT